MEQYISQLIEDILLAHRTKDDSVQNKDDSFEAHIAEVERYLSGEGEQKISDLCGLESVQFPPKQRLSETQMKQVAEAYEKMLHSWNIDIYIPEKLPVSLRYDLLIGTLERKVFVTNDEYSHVGIDLCNFDVDNCPFGTEYCTCKDEMKLWEGENGVDDEETPF